VCLLGAGYSLAGTDQKQRFLPRSSDLVDEIKIALGLGKDDYATLSDVADYCDEFADRQRILRLLLIDRLTLCNPSDDQVEIISQSWRSIFTTNFDDIVERALPASKIQVITPTDESIKHKRGKTPLYYMHGRAADLVESDVDPKFVISERNYLDLHQFNKALYSRLKNELYCANMIAIVGYSVRDLEVARMVMEGGFAFQKKTVIICDSAETPMALSRLKKFGHVLPIGISGLADALRGLKRSHHTPQNHAFQFVDAISPAAPSDKIEGDDFVNLILTGNFSPEKYQAQLQLPANAANLYCVRRKESLELITSSLSYGGGRFLISSDLGNGKSMFLDQLSGELIGAGYRVIRISSKIDEVFSELELALSLREPLAFLIDDVIRHRRVAEFLGVRLTAQCILVCAFRGGAGEVVFQDVASSLGGDVRLIDLNRLSISELHDWDLALERWGLWEHRISLTKDQRISFLATECGSENRSIVLSLFKNSHIASRIDQIVSFFLKAGRYERAFAALLTSSLCQQHVSWESLVNWLSIDEAKLRADISKSDISALFINGRSWNILTSAQLAEYILRTKYVNFDKEILIDVFSTIVLSTAESADDSYLGAIFKENLKELMKFRFLTRLFGDSVEAAKLIGAVYSRLSAAPLIRRNPQFWLQYAMSRMEVNDLQNAEAYLKTALGLAKQIGADYSPYQIIDQSVRLYFRKNSEPGDKFSKSEIRKAISDLKGLLRNPESEIIYLYRSVPLIRDFLDSKFDYISKDIKQEIESVLIGIDERAKSFVNLPRSQKGETRVLRKAMSEALYVLSLA